MKLSCGQILPVIEDLDNGFTIFVKTDYMKRTLLSTALLLLCIFSIEAKKQPVTEYLNFKVDNGVLIWAKVYDFAQTDSVAVREWFNQEFILTKNEDSVIYGETRKEILPYQAVGLKTGYTSMILLDPCVVYFTIHLKEGRYKVIVNKIVWDWLTLTSSSNEKISLSQYSISEGAIKPRFISSGAAKQLDDILSYLFQPKVLREDTDW